MIMIILLKLRGCRSLIDDKIIMQKQSTFYELKPENSIFIRLIHHFLVQDLSYCYAPEKSKFFTELYQVHHLSSADTHIWKVSLM